MDVWHHQTCSFILLTMLCNMFAFGETLALDSDIFACWLMMIIFLNGFVFVSAVWPPLCHGCIYLVVLEVTTLLLLSFWYTCFFVLFLSLWACDYCSVCLSLFEVCLRRACHSSLRPLTDLPVWHIQFTLGHTASEVPALNWAAQLVQQYNI